MKTLFRPVGLTEMKLILDLELKAFPPRLPEQPIFYPVLNKEYAAEIAHEWNTKDKFSGYVGFVTEFTVKCPFIDKYEEQIVGSRTHEELWIPSEELEEMNANIDGRIKLIDVFYGKEYEGITSDSEPFQEKTLMEQLRLWHELCVKDWTDFNQEIREQWKFIFMNYSYWVALDPTLVGLNEKLKNKVLSKMHECWKEHLSDISLLGGIHV
ncbi:hypothetical protein H8B09_29830 [Paenibacillus sp. PR3]|uniref:Uncharacterized protein n=1 Tax=Paenibacillus terricola TaxID=2763503 RepID=A0ABR8N4Z1_9BACL|nr:hypothetical protein [Paenibacillus terricola]MBD3922945.1 hypothetical protein [Paenibacillus terricola]